MILYVLGRNGMDIFAQKGLHRFWHPAGFPLLVAQGPLPGLCLVVSAGVHGDEYEGVRAIFETFSTLDVSQLRGSLVAVPILNLPAHRAVSRLHPADGLNLARVFPGDPDGQPSQRLAHAFAHDVLARADFYLDLHSGGLNYAMPSMVGYELSDHRARAAAEAFAAPVIWGHPLIEPGRTISFARSRQIPFLYTEAAGAGRIAPDDLAMMRRGIRNLLHHLGILPGTPSSSSPPLRLTGIGNTDLGLSASQDGFWMPSVRILSPLAPGQLIGSICNPLGEILEEIRSPQAGIVGLLRELPPVQAGDTLVLIAQEENP